jgi:hypothetical protein
MTTTSHIRRLTLIALIGCAILIGWSSAASARPIDDPALPTTPAASAAEPRTGPAEDGTDWTVPIALGGAVALIAIGGTVGYAVRTRAARRAIA